MGRLARVVGGAGGAVCALMVMAPLLAAPARADDAAAPTFGTISSRRLDNGMTVVVQEDHRAPVVSLSLRYDAGERAAPEGAAGVATLTTALMLRATKHVPPGDYQRLLVRAGATVLADTTTSDTTLLEVEVPAERIELPLWLWSDQMGFFSEAIDDAQLELRRTSLKDQRRTWLDTTPLSRIALFAEQEMLPADHVYRRALYATPEDIDHVDRAAVIAFHDSWITPDHATLAVVGDVTQADGFALVERYFAAIPSPQKTRHIERPPPIRLAGQTIVDIAANVPGPRVVIRWPTPRLLTKEDARLDILARILDGHRTAWLYWSLVDQKKAAQKVTVRQISRDLQSELEVSIVGAPGTTPAQILGDFDASMVTLRTRRADRATIDMAAYETTINRAVSLESPRVRASRMAGYGALVGTPNYFRSDLGRYDRVSPDEIKDAVDAYLPDDRRVVLLVTPDASAPIGGERRARRFVPAGTP